MIFMNVVGCRFVNGVLVPPCAVPEKEAVTFATPVIVTVPEPPDEFMLTPFETATFDPPDTGTVPVGV
jgi:hypothetical protein